MVLQAPTLEATWVLISVDNVGSHVVDDGNLGGHLDGGHVGGNLGDKPGVTIIIIDDFLLAI